MAPKAGSDDAISNTFMDTTDQKSEVCKPSEITADLQQVKSIERRIVWRNVLLYSGLHLAAAYGFYVAMTQAMWMTLIWSYALYIIGGLGITAGAHRLWSHRSYKATAPMRFMLMIFNCIALQNDVIEWARDHRVHHKYSETNADPHNATKGFFFSHVGWLLVRKHPDVIKKGKNIDLSDLYNDKILAFQRKFYPLLAIFFCFVMPTLVPMYMWNESAWTAYFTAGLFRYTWLLHCTWAINSIAHLFGNRPYDKNINPRQNIWTSLCSLGEGWHNYHHSFPYDYRASEMPYMINFTTAFIDMFAMIGWVYDRKAVSKEAIDMKKLRSGEHSHHHNHNHNHEHEHEY
jgi:stearoyl-CoA desaturase (delta-9 desaturase)